MRKKMKFLRDNVVVADTVCVMREDDYHKYHLNPSEEPDQVVDNYSEGCQTITFQNGPINEVGINGVTEASLIKVLIDRFEYFQSVGNSRFKTKENECVLDNLYCCLCKINQRSLDRSRRGVEGYIKP